MSSPFAITGRTAISLSGGRTSAYLLARVLEEAGGTLPDEVEVVFANTGKEREETLRFVHEIGVRWGVRVRWVEFRSRLKRDRPEDRFEEVGYNSASRNGEPLARLIRSKKILPNSFRRFCTEDAKVETMTQFFRAKGWEAGSYAELVGLRADEPKRVERLGGGRNADRDVRAPLALAGVTKQDVAAFWAAQPFDLQLAPSEGNCDLCFLKGKRTLINLIRRNPSSAEWWIAMEEANPRKGFSDRYSYAELRAEAISQRRQGDLLDPLDDEEFDAECGTSCAPGEAYTREELDAQLDAIAALQRAQRRLDT